MSRPALRFILVFLAVLLPLAGLRASGLETPAAARVGAVTAGAAHVLLRPLQPGLQRSGNLHAGPHGALEIAEPCSGFELIALLLAALVAFPLARRRRALALLLLVPFVLALNVVRVARLALLLESGAPVFETAHLFVWQGFLVLAGLAYWLVWAAPATEVA